MKVGMLWYDNDTKTALVARVERAAQYYKNKYGKPPTLCFVHPSMLPAPETQAPEEEPKLKSGEVEVRTSPAVLPNHFWIGVSPAQVSGD